MGMEKDSSLCKILYGKMEALEFQTVYDTRTWSMTIMTASILTLPVSANFLNNCPYLPVLLGYSFPYPPPKDKAIS